ncbi:hypothetical protein NQ317_018833 [Molorchus minor]|uniref:cellulase n=1 Tax=Molorchus minor TaxID=1323400 RepID=A0ABQ9IWW9_9CUCU|nr:hypothetical protein NQ317_018833 [Molorchus minor]
MLCFVPVAACVVSSTAQTINVEPIDGGLTGVGFATRMWDCCKPACSWASIAKVDPPVEACEADGVTRADPLGSTGCDEGGTTFICTDQHSWVVNSTFALGYSGASFIEGGGSDSSMCCACFLLEYTGTQGKKFVVQVINEGSDYSQNQFDLVFPGGGVGLMDTGCTRQWGAPVGGWGEQYGGVTSEEECSELPTQLQEYCHFRWQFLEDVSNENLKFTQVTCPAELTEHTGCVRP